MVEHGILKWYKGHGDSSSGGGGAAGGGYSQQPVPTPNSDCRHTEII